MKPGCGVEDALIRTYRASDEAALIALWRECGLVVPWNDPKKDIDRKLTENPDQLHVAEADGEIVGSCMSGYDGHRGWIYYLAVAPQHRRRGLATRLMRHAEDELRRLGCPKIDLMVRDTNAEVIAFYRAIGYRQDAVVVLSHRLEDDNRAST